MYEIDEWDHVVELSDVPRPEPGAACPIVLAEEGRLVLSYQTPNTPSHSLAATCLAMVRFTRPYMHFFGPPNDEALAGHPLSCRGLRPYGVYRVDHSSLIRRLELESSTSEVSFGEEYSQTLRAFR